MSIRSFVKRQGRMTDKQKQALNDLWSVYGVDCQECEIDFDQLFERPAAVTVEIGFGMGQSLLTTAIENPEKNFLGIEVHEPGVGKLLSMIAEHQLKNIRVMKQDAVMILNQCIADKSVAEFNIFFPDPWPKKRHHKRRLIQVEFVALLVKKLKSGGILHLATDVEDYAEHMLDVVNQQPQLVNQAPDNRYVERPDFRPVTKFENKATTKIFDIVCHMLE